MTSSSSPASQLWPPELEVSWAGRSAPCVPEARSWCCTEKACSINHLSHLKFKGCEGELLSVKVFALRKRKILKEDVFALAYSTVVGSRAGKTCVRFRSQTPLETTHFLPFPGRP